MPEIARESSLSSCSFLIAPVVRAYTILRAVWDYYSPPTWLLLYYPLLYLAKVAERLSVLNAERGNDSRLDVKPAPIKGQGLSWILTHVGLETATTTMSAAILGQLLYVLLLRCGFLGRDFWKGTQSVETEMDAPHSLAHEVPDRLLHTSVEIGLDKHEVIARRKAYGVNELRSPRSWIPCGFLALNIRGANQKIRQSDEIAQSLAWDPSNLATTLRESNLFETSVRELVPDDIVRVSEVICLSRSTSQSRNLTTATGLRDTRRCSGSQMDSTLYIDRSTITGDSDHVKKYHDICYTGSSVVRGDALLMVVGTSYHTFLGRTLFLIGDPMPERQSVRTVAVPRHVLQYNRVLRSIGGILCALSLAPVSIDWVFSNSTRSSHQILELAVGLAIVAIPISQNIILPIYRSRGAARLADDGALVNGAELMGVESLAGVDTLCCDKTGTITENCLTVLDPYCISCDPEDVIVTACLASSPDKHNLDPIDQAMATALEQYPQAKAKVEGYKILDWQPFNVETKLMQALVESPLGERMLCVKGAPRAVLETYLQDHQDQEDLMETYKSTLGGFAERGLRCLGIARKKDNSEWELLGAVPMEDPPRSDTASAVQLANTLGVSVKICTGDAVSPLRLTTKSIGMDANILEGETIGTGEETLNSKTITRIEAADAYAEVFPVHKAKIVRALQSRGRLVAVTGDGGSDVPTLRRADCGIAIKGAVEKAQSASDIVFIKNPGLSSIITAIQTSRQTFQQVHDYITYRTTLSLHLMLVMLWYFGTYNEVLDLRLLILDLHISDIVALVFIPDDANIPFSKKPRRWSFRKLLAEVLPLTFILVLGSWLSAVAIQVQGMSTPNDSLADPAGSSASRCQVVFLHIVLSDHWMSFLTHTDGRFWAYAQSRKVIWTLFCIDLLATLLCVTGSAGQGHGVSVSLASWAWLVSFGTFCGAAGLRYMTSDGQLVERQLSTKKSE